MPKLSDRKDDQHVTFVKNGFAITVDSEDYLRTVRHGWNISSNGSSLQATIDKKRWTIGKFILNYLGLLTVDHKDRNICHNCKNNLRICTSQQQAMNRGPVKGKRFKGVYWKENQHGWHASLKIGKFIHTGEVHKTEEAAAKAYDKLAKKYFKEFAYLNFPGEINAQVN